MQEDFHTLTYGFKMAGDEADAAVMSAVKELEEELGRIIKVWISDALDRSNLFILLPRLEMSIQWFDLTGYSVSKYSCLEINTRGSMA